MHIALRVYGSGSCCILDSNINQRINIYISTEDGCNYIELYVYIWMYVSRKIMIVGTCMWRLNRFRFLNIISADEHAYLL